jgi:predicted SAM-dependent methyltransferase
LLTLETRVGRILHVGCGGETLPDYLQQYDEVRLDIDPQFQPDILASITDLGEIGQFDGVFCSHILEHLYPHDLPRALAEVRRVLVPNGFFIAFVPDLEGVRPTEETVYISPSGPVCGLDMFYGLRKWLKEMPYMAHHNGFVQATLQVALEAAGFSKVIVNRVGGINLMGACRK